MKKFICLISVSLFFLSAFAQENSEDNNLRKMEYRLTAGYNIGGASPIPLPDNIREIKSYNPGFNPSMGVEAVYKINKKWGVGLNPRIDHKGMKVKDSVMYFHTIIQEGEGAEASSFEGAFSGTNYTNAQNLYVGVPVFLQFTPKEKWHFKLGGYFAFLLNAKFEGTVSDGYIRNGGSLGEVVEITSASFEFSDKVQKFDYGLFGGMRKDLGERFSIDLSLQWGLTSIFPSSFSGVNFPMYNIFAQIGGGYRF